MDGTHCIGKRAAAILLGFFAAAALMLPSAQAAERTVSELIPVGQVIGVKLFSDGVLVVGLSDGESPAKACGLKEGDVITAVGGQELDTIEEFRQLLAENGADVALAYRKSTVEAEQLREEITAMGRSCIAVQADVSVSADVDRFVTQAAQALGGIDILVNISF